MPVLRGHSCLCVQIIDVKVDDQVECGCLKPAAQEKWHIPTYTLQSFLSKAILVLVNAHNERKKYFGMSWQHLGHFAPNNHSHI